MKLKYLSAIALMPLATLSATNVAAITIGTYNLSNHPNGGISPPLYGLRLDGLLGDNSKEYTFDFDHSDSDMTLTWDGSKIVIDGQSFGGEDIGGSYGVTAIWDIHFEYTVGIMSPGGEGGVDDVYVYSDNANFGSIRSVLGSYSLEDQSTDDQVTSLAFQLGDEDGSGHRGFSGISGWGWMNHGVLDKTNPGCEFSDCTHVYASDWLFTAELTEVPVPAAAWLFGSGLLALIGVTRRKA